MRKDRGPEFPRNPPEWNFDDLSAEKLEKKNTYIKGHCHNVSSHKSLHEHVLTPWGTVKNQKQSFV